MPTLYKGPVGRDLTLRTGERAKESVPPNASVVRGTDV